jgi:hypothetical protein
MVLRTGDQASRVMPLRRAATGRPGRRRYADLVVIGVLVSRSPCCWRQSDISQQSASDPAIAVLPFENIGGNPEREYFADGLARVLDRQACQG